MKSKKTSVILIIMIFAAGILGCGLNIFKYESYKYTGDIDFAEYEWLKGKKIFVDPGHGGKGASDRFRIGPGGITEEEVNLRVGMILKDMLEKSGAIVGLSREKDVDISLDDRVDMVNKFLPDLLISLHHNGSARRVDDVNYPLVFIWGNRKVRPLSYTFAEYLLDEFQRIMDEKGVILSDFSVFKETGTRILRETKYTCPGVIGEPGFFSDETHSKRLNDILYNQEEAEAYFYAIAKFFERGVPKAEVLTSSLINNETYLSNLLTGDHPLIALSLDSGREGLGIIGSSLAVTLDGIPVICRKAADNLYYVEYGSKLYPGGHSIRFSFKNQRQQSSMIYSCGFTIDIKKGDYKRLVTEGTRLLKYKGKYREGLKMLLSAFSMATTDPDADGLIWNIARGFNMIGDKVNSDYYYSKLYNFYPQSKYVSKLESRFRGYRFPVEYNGKWIDIKYDPSLKETCKK